MTEKPLPDNQLISPEYGGKFLWLAQLKNISLLKWKIPEFHGVTSKEELKTLLFQIDPKKLYAVRSSGLNEDSDNASLAWHFNSYLEVPYKSIIHRYNSIQTDAENKWELTSIPVVIQEMVMNPEFAGVAFSRSVENAHYISLSFAAWYWENVVNWTQTTQEIKIHRLAKVGTNLDKKYPFLEEILICIGSIEKHFWTPMDIEFAVKDNTVYILQARPIISYIWEQLETKETKDTKKLLDWIRKQASQILRHRSSMLGSMIDINPWDLLWESPRPLSVSLFSELFPDWVIKCGRDSLGYSCSPDNCLHTIWGRPYIDLETAANNFRPAGISDQAYKKITNYYLKIMEEKQEVNSSAEFGLFFIFDDDYAQRELNRLFWTKSLPILEKYRQLWKKLEQHSETMFTGWFNQRLLQLNKLRDTMLDDLKNRPNTLIDVRSKINKIVKLLKKYTEFFVVIARLDFYQNYKLRWFIQKHWIENLHEYMGWVSTFYIQRMCEQIDIIEWGMTEDSVQLHIDRFGHMRYHQFDLNVPSDRERIWAQLGLINVENLRKQLIEFERSKALSHEKLEQLWVDQWELKKCIQYARYFDAGREETKFQFMKLYDALRQELKDFSYFSDIPFEDLFFLKNDDLVWKISPTLLQTLIKTRKNIYEKFREIEMPDHIFCPDDVYGFELPQCTPTYIGSQQIQDMPILTVWTDIIGWLKECDVCGKLILLKDSDQWAASLLSFNPAWVITKIGSAHSHLSVIMRELGIPAILNIGEQEFNKFTRASAATIHFWNKSYQLT